MVADDTSTVNLPDPVTLLHEARSERDQQLDGALGLSGGQVTQ
ncbi:MAG: hypothetical protein Q4E12_00775 [Coriobacteriia bacterium]|nr:hypothetical protein [Coriobacteriia bacterium]